MISDTHLDTSPRLTQLSFSEDIQKLTEVFVAREWVFEQIREWVSNSVKTFFILTGEAGIGKSAIAARLTQIRDDVVAHHFCIAGRNSTVVPGTALRSIAAQLGSKLQDYGLALANTIKPEFLSVNVNIYVGTMNGGQLTGVVINNLTVTDPKQEIESLLTAPLKAMPAPKQPVLIVLDSLDEAFTYNPSENLVTLFAGLKDLPRWVRVVLTSRPDRRVLSYFASAHAHVVPAESHLNREDLRRYVNYRVSKPAISARIRESKPSLTAETLVERVAGKDADPGLADGNFLYTKILLNDIESGVQPLADLDELPKSLDEIYEQFLLRLQPEWESKYQPLLAVLAVVREPLTKEQLVQFGRQSAGMVGGRMNATLVNLALNTLVQFLDTKGEAGREQYALFHKSFRDYLGDQARSGGFACPPEDGHAAIANYYWQASSHKHLFRGRRPVEYFINKLKQYCRVFLPTKNTQQAIFDHADGGYDWSACDTYGLAHLPEHLLKAGRKEDLNNLLFDYVWLQVKLDRLGIQALLEDFRLSQLSADDATLQLGRALEQGAYVLAKDLTQLAAQLLGRLVGDEDEQMQRLFTKARQRCSRPCLLPQTASLRQEYALLRTLAGHTDLVTGVVVTPDGGRAISSSWDKTLKVWDLASGQELLTLSGHTDLVTDVAVTPDGSRAISSSYDNTLKVWDLASGSCFATFHADGSLRVCAVSLDGSIVATAGESGRVHFLRLEE